MPALAHQVAATLPTAPPRPTVLQASDVSVALDGVPVLRGVSLSLRHGEVLALVGPNGAGKSTLLRALAGLLPAEGRVTLAGRDLAGLEARTVAQSVARVPQSTAHDGGFSVEDLVLAGRTPHLGWLQWETAHDRRIAGVAMRQTDTSHLAPRLAADLSGGERQRVFLARALAQQPSILLLDEPTANLDLAHQVQVLDLVRSLVEGADAAAIAAIHDLEMASRYGDRLLLLDAGRVVADGPPADVLTPERLRAVFGVEAVVEPNPHVRGLRITVLGTAPTEHETPSPAGRGLG